MPNGKPSPAAAQQHVLRPSSRQDHCASDAPPAQPATAGSALLGGAPSVAAATLPSAPHADAWWLGSGTDGGALAASGEEEGEEMETRAAVSIVPAAEDGGIGESRLVLLLGSGPARAAGQGAGAPACGVVEAAAAQVEGAAGGGVPVEEAVGLRLAHEVHIWGSAEDGEVAPGLDAVVAAKEVGWHAAAAAAGCVFTCACAALEQPLQMFGPAGYGHLKRSLPLHVRRPSARAARRGASATLTRLRGTTP